MSNSENENKKNQLAIVLKYQGALAAEGHLTDIANKEGDEAVMLIAGHLSAAEVAQVTSEADVVKPSLLHTAINIEQFRGVFRRVGVQWSDAAQSDCSPETLWEFQEELQQFLCAFILLNEEGDRRNKLMEVILDEPHGLDTLVFSTVQEKDFAEFMEHEGHVADIGDWREVLWVLRTGFPEQWDRFKKRVPATFDGADYVDFIHEIAAEIYAVATMETGAIKETEGEKADDLFTPLK